MGAGAAVSARAGLFPLSEHVFIASRTAGVAPRSLRFALSRVVGAKARQARRMIAAISGLLYVEPVRNRTRSPLCSGAASWACAAVATSEKQRAPVSALARRDIIDSVGW